MNIRIWKILLFCLLPISFNSMADRIIIQTEKKINWQHPVLNAFKKHGISLRKIRYLGDGTCPVFYADFETSPKNRSYYDAYTEILAGNYNFPYAIVDTKNKLMINVGWGSHIPKRMLVSFDPISPHPACLGGFATMRFKYKMDENLKRNILKSPYKASMKNRNGKEMIAYLYAENAIIEQAKEHEEHSEDPIKNSAEGIYYIYLYDPEMDTFLPERIEPFYSSQGFEMIQGRSDFLVLPHNKRKQSDVLIIGKFANPSSDWHEAYGFSDDGMSLKKYRFVDKTTSKALFYGRLFRNSNKVLGYTKDNDDEIFNPKRKQFSFKISKTPGEINVTELNVG